MWYVFNRAFQVFWEMLWERPCGKCGLHYDRKKMVKVAYNKYLCKACAIVDAYKTLV